jgi:hypothetical protein
MYRPWVVVDNRQDANNFNQNCQHYKYLFNTCIAAGQRRYIGS